MKLERVGDCWDRYVRSNEMGESLRIIEQAFDQCPKAILHQPFPKGLSHLWVKCIQEENPRGELGYYIISDGSTSPFRVKVRRCVFEFQV